MLTSKKVVIADPDESDLAYMKAVVRSKGYDAVAVKDGILAWNEMQAEKLPDLVIIALQLGGVSGLEFCRRCKRDERLRSVPILVVCDRSMGAGRSEQFWRNGLGSDDFMFKPFDPLGLLGRIQVLLLNSPARPQATPTPAPAPAAPVFEPRPQVVSAIFEAEGASRPEPEDPDMPAPAAESGQVLSLKDANAADLTRAYLSAAAKGDFGLEYDIMDTEMHGDIARDQYVTRRAVAYREAGSPVSEIIDLETKESHNVSKVTCRRAEIIDGVKEREVVEEYCFKKTFRGWKLITVRGVKQDPSVQE